MAFNGDALRELAAQFLALAEKQGATAPLMIGHRVMGISCCARETSRKAACTTIRRSRFTILSSIARWRRDLARTPGVNLVLPFDALWLLGYPEAALADTERALSEAREIGQAATLMFALLHAGMTQIRCGNYAAAKRSSMNSSLWRTKKAHRSGKRTECKPRLHTGPRRQGFGGRPHDKGGDRLTPSNGSDSVLIPRWANTISESIHGPRPIR